MRLELTEAEQETLCGAIGRLRDHEMLALDAIRLSRGKGAEARRIALQARIDELSRLLARVTRPGRRAK